MEGPREIQLNKPDPFNPSKNNTSEDWRIWKQNFSIYLELTEARRKLSERGLALILLNLMGAVGIEAKENMTFDDPIEEENMEILLKKFDEVFDPPLNEMEQRYKFFSRRKYDTETIQNYVTCLKELASTCNFGKQAEKFILDMVVLNMDSYLQKKIFLIQDLSLYIAIKMFKKDLLKEEKLRNIYATNFDNLLLTDDLADTKNANVNYSQNINKQEGKAEIAKDRLNIIENASKNNLYQPIAKVCFTCFETGHDTAQCNTVCGICSEMGHNTKDCNKSKKNVDHQQSSRSRDDYKNQASAVNFCFKCQTHHKLNECPTGKNQNSTKRVCFRCNKQHPPKQCPAYNVTCFKCHKLGHFDYACKSKNIPNSFLICDRCNTRLLEHNEYYNVCPRCNAFIEIGDDSDSDSSENTQPRRRRRRQRRNKQNKNEESCCIS